MSNTASIPEGEEVQGVLSLLKKQRTVDGKTGKIIHWKNIGNISEQGRSGERMFGELKGLCRQETREEAVERTMKAIKLI